jgi:ribose transport system permease protein
MTQHKATEVSSPSGDPGSPTTPAAPAAGAGVGRFIPRSVGRFGLIGVLAALVLGFSIALPSTFFTHGNFNVMLNSQAILLLLALAETVVLRSGDFDLSIAGVMGVTGAVTGEMMLHGNSLILTILVCLVIGILIGAINAFFIVKLGMNAFVTTLGSLTTLEGLAYGITNNHVITGFPNSLATFTQHTIGGLYLSTIYGWGLVLVLFYVFEFTPFGRQLLFVGGNRDAARLAGVSVERVRSSAFVASGAIAAFAGVILAGVIGSFDPSSPPQYMLQPFAAAFLGASTIYIGRFNAFGTLIGLYLLIVGVTGLELYGVPTWVASVFNGLALVLAIGVARAADPEKRRD